MSTKWIRIVEVGFGASFSDWRDHILPIRMLPEFAFFEIGFVSTIGLEEEVRPACEGRAEFFGPVTVRGAHIDHSPEIYTRYSKSIKGVGQRRRICSRTIP